MNKANYRRWLLASLVLLVPLIANAVGLGKLTVLSSLGQPFNAEIDLLSVQKEELSTLSAQLASMDAYRQFDLQYNAVLAGLHFHLEKRSDGQAYIKLTSERTVNDPYVDLLIELKWASGRLVREYTALIDPGGYAPAKAFVSAPMTVAQTRAVPSPRPPVAIAFARPALTTPVAAVEYGPVKRGETLSKIAFKVKPDGVSLEQMMVGLLRNNPDAFINNNMNRLKADQILRNPDNEQLITISQSDAVREVRFQVENRSRYRRNGADTADTASARKVLASQRQKVSAQDKTVIEKPVLRLSSGDSIWLPREAK